MPTTNHRTNGEVTVTSTDKNRALYQVPFHKGNTEALAKLATAYGVNTTGIGRPLTVPQYLRALALSAIRNEAEQRGFDYSLEEKLEQRYAIPAAIINWPEELQTAIMALPTAAQRNEAIASVQAEAVRQQMLQNGSMLSAIASAIASNPKSAAESK